MTSGFAKQKVPFEPGTSPPPQRPLSIGFVLAHNFTLSAFSLFVDQFRLAADDGDRSRPIQCRWSIMANSAESIRSSCGLQVNRTGSLTDPRQFDYIVVVGGLLHGGAQLDDETMGYLRLAADKGVPLVGICTGSFILCRAGLMEGRKSCVSWYHFRDFAEEFPDQEVVADRMFVVDGDRITCSGGGGSADLASFLIERHFNHGQALKARQVMLLDGARQGNDIQPHPPLDDAIMGTVTDKRVRQALLLMEQRLSDPMPIHELAGRLKLSTRHVERLFQDVVGAKPRAVYRTMRLRHARWLLENTRRSITSIAVDTGFSDGAHFSRQFKEMTGLSPREARRQPVPDVLNQDLLSQRIASLTLPRAVAQQ